MAESVYEQLKKIDTGKEPIDGKAIRANIKNAEEIATIFTEVVEKKGWWTPFKGGNKHLDIEAWIFLAVKLYGYIPRITYVKQLEENDVGKGFAMAYEAQAELIEIDSKGNEIVLARGWSSAGTHGDTFFNKIGHSSQSMAQTRALSKVISSYFRFLPPLAGFSGTPIEEMPDGDRQTDYKAPAPAPAPAPSTPPAKADYEQAFNNATTTSPGTNEVPITPGQITFLHSLRLANQKHFDGKYTPDELDQEKIKHSVTKDNASAEIENLIEKGCRKHLEWGS